MKIIRKLSALLLMAAVLVSLAVPGSASEAAEPYATVTTSHRDAEFTYELFLTDTNGYSVTNPRTLGAGDKLSVEIRLTRSGYKSPSYESYGIEFRLLTRGLSYNYDGVSLRSGTDVREQVYADGNSVGFAWYDMQQQGESINNPVLAASWSYTVADPAMVNITVPVALIYITGQEDGYVAQGPAILYLDPNGGKIIGKDVSGTYTSGDTVTLPDAKLGDAVFLGWSDGAKVYPAGSQYTVSGIVTLVAQWGQLNRNRYLTLDPNGGTLLTPDISGYYADGETVILPEVTREGYRFLGWHDGTALYEAGAEYTVFNTVTITAQWEALTGEEPGPEEPAGGSCWIWILLGIGIFWWLILLLWLRRWVKYSLVNGDVALNYRNGEGSVRVSVILLDGDQEHFLAKSSTLKEKRRLRYITNMGRFPIAQVETGRYKGKLVITDGTRVTVKKCRIKVLDRELKRK